MSERDPLEAFDPGSVPVTAPLTAPEVRRLGNRRRARRQAAAGAAAVAVAVIAIAAGGVALGLDRGDGPRPIDPATQTPSATPTDSRVVTEIPETFSITDGWPEAASTAADPLADDGGWQITPCNVDYPVAETVDRLGARLDSPETLVRELLTFRSADAATSWVKQTRLAAQACTPPADQSGVRRGLVVRQFDLAGDGSLPSTAIWWTTEEGGEAGPGQALVQLTARGNAVLLDQSGRAATWQAPFDDEFQQLSQASYGRSVGVVESMCLFSGDCPTLSSAPEPTQEATPLTMEQAPASELVGQGDVPDQPLRDGLPDLTGDGGELLGPSADVEGIDRLLVCGTPVVDQDLEITGRLVGSSSGPEYWEARQVVAYADADAAVAQLAHVRQLLASCERQPAAGGEGAPPADLMWISEDTDTGYDTVSFAYGAVLPGTDRPAYPSGQVVQMTRIGRAVFVTTTSGESSLADFSAAVQRLTPVTVRFVPQLCGLTADGC